MREQQRHRGAESVRASEISLQLQSERFGPIEIIITTTEGRVDLCFRVVEERARRALEKHLGSLKDALAERHVACGSVSCQSASHLEPLTQPALEHFDARG